MEWWYHLPTVTAGLFAFLFGLGVGSFINVLVVRLPFEKSIVWPGSRCFVCYRPIALLDNLPIVGYLRLRGRCRACKAPFSARYLWVELFTGLAFLALFLVEIVPQVTDGGRPVYYGPWHHTPGLHQPFFSVDLPAVLKAAVYFAAHAFLLSALIAAALVDLRHRIVPAEITFATTAIGLLVATLLPWPWPNLPADAAHLPVAASWVSIDPNDRIPEGICLWPFWGPWPRWAPPGSTLLGLLNGLVGAAVGMAIARGIKGLFGFGSGKDALGMGDADVLMMAGSFLGWQAIALALPIGAVYTLAAVIPVYVVAKIRKRPFDPAVPFAPGIAAGIVTCWWGWPWLTQLVRVPFFEPLILGLVVGVVGIGLLVFGFLLRRR